MIRQKSSLKTQINENNAQIQGLEHDILVLTEVSREILVFKGKLSDLDEKIQNKISLEKCCRHLLALPFRKTLYYIIILNIIIDSW